MRFHLNSLVFSFRTFKIELEQMFDKRVSGMKITKILEIGERSFRNWNH